MTAFTITTQVRVPRPAGEVGIPIAWLHDNAITHDAGGLLARILSHAEPGVEVTGADLGQPHPSDPPIAELVTELVDAGYLVPAGDNRYDLVHPERLGPLPTISQERTHGEPA